MQVKYLVSEAAVAWSRIPGGVYDLPDDEAMAAITAGKAEPFIIEPEAATRSARETAMKPTPKGR